jgi:hypothetical protein
VDAIDRLCQRRLKADPVSPRRQGVNIRAALTVWSAHLSTVGIRSGRVAGGRWLGGDRWPGRGRREHRVPWRDPLFGPGPVRRQVQDSAALWSGQSGGHADDLATQCGPTCEGVAGADTPINAGGVPSIEGWGDDTRAL